MDIKKIEEERDKIKTACAEMLKRKIFCKKEFIEAKLKHMELERQLHEFDKILQEETVKEGKAKNWRKVKG